MQKLTREQVEEGKRLSSECTDALALCTLTAPGAAKERAWEAFMDRREQLLVWLIDHAHALLAAAERDLNRVPVVGEVS